MKFKITNLQSHTDFPLIIKGLKKALKYMLGVLVPVILVSYAAAFWNWENGLIPKSVLLWPYNTLQQPTPLWATILLILVFGLYVSRKKKESPALPAPPTSLAKYFTIDSYRWKTTIYRDNKYEVERIPLCAKHDLPMVSNGRFYYCPEMTKSSCFNRLTILDYPLTYQKAKSYIDKEIRNGK